MDDRAQTYVDASKRIVDELVKQGKPVPEELVQTQWILEMWCNNADRIAKSLTDSRRRKSGDDLSTIEQLLREQDKYMSQMTELYQKLSDKPLVPEENAATS